MSRNSKDYYKNLSTSRRHHHFTTTRSDRCKSPINDDYDRRHRSARDNTNRTVQMNLKKSRKLVWNIIKNRRKERKARERHFEESEYRAMIEATQDQLKDILENDEYLCDVSNDCTVEELEGMIALAKEHPMTIYIQRDGLSTLKIVLPQEKPTIANLKRAIERTSRIQLKREQRQRLDRLRRCETEQQFLCSKYKAVSDNVGDVSMDDDDDKGYYENMKSGANKDDDRKQVSTVPTNVAESCLLRRGKKSKNEQTLRLAGELVYSEAARGQQHRSNVSWRFLWRAFALFNVRTKLPLDDKNGRMLLSECDIRNDEILKFCGREKYFGRIRQK